MRTSEIVLLTSVISFLLFVTVLLPIVKRRRQSHSYSTLDSVRVQLSRFVVLISVALPAWALFMIGTASAAGTTFVTNGSSQIGSFPSSLPNNSFRIDTGTTNSANVTSISANFVGSSSATLSPTTGWTQVQNASADDSNLLVSFGFNTTFNGTSYSGAYIGSNTYITFGSGSSLYSGLAANVPAIPGVHMCAADNSYQKVFYKLDSTGVMRVRYEGNNSTSGTVGSPTIVYEAVFYSGQSYFDVHMGSNSRCGGDTTPPTVSTVSSNKANGSYKVGEVIDIDVTFSEAVTSTGNVTVTLETGSTDRTCTFTVTSATFGTCNYTVQSGDTSADLNVNSVTGTIKDAANNALTNTTPVSNLAANKAIVIDTTSPTVSNITSSLANGSYKVGQVVPVQVVFAESVLVASGTPQIVIATGSPATTTLSYASGSGSTTLVFNYTVGATDYSNDLDHASTSALSLNGSTIKDAAGNAASLSLPSPGAAGSLSANKAIVIDNTAPTVAITSTALNPTNASIPVSVTFSESVTGFVVGDISITNGSAGSFSGAGASYTFNVTPTTQGAVSISLSAGVAADSAGNNSVASNTISRTYDSVAPSLAITTNVASPTLQTPIPFTATFSENVSGFDLTDVTVTNGTLGNFQAISSTVFTFDVSPTGHPINNVEVYVSVASGGAQDNAGNNNSSSDSGTPYNIRFDNHSPTVGLTTSATQPTKSAAIAVTATFSESVSGFDAGDLTTSNASVSNFSGSGTTYTFTLTPLGQGVVSVQVPASVAQDGATNLNLVSNVLSRTYDSVAPAVTLSTTASNPNNSAFISVVAEFSESVTGFIATDLAISNGVTSNFSGAGSMYTFDVSPVSQGAMTISVPSASAIDAAGNDSTASSTLSRTYDSLGPTLLEVTPVPVYANDATPSYGFSASEDATLSYDGDCSSATSNATLGNNTITFDSLSDGEHTNCAVIATDALGNVGSALVVSAFTVDSTSPTVTLSSTSPSPTNAAPIPVVVEFSEAVTGFVVGDISVSNGTAGNFTGSGSTYSFDVTPSAQGLVSISLLSSIAQDAAGNGSALSNTIAVTYDSVVPTVTLSSTSPSPTNAAPIPVVVEFSEAVTQFALGDIAVTNGTAASLSGSGSSYAFSITPSSDGAVTVSIPLNSAQDAAGNLSDASNSLTRVFDSTAPTVNSILLSDTTLTAGDTATVTMSFSEPVSNFSNADITTIENGSMSNVSSSDSGLTWTATFTPAEEIEDATNLITVTKSTLTDIAGNAGTDKTDSENYVIETKRPVITSISSDKSNGTYKVDESIDIDVTFSETVTSTGNVSLYVETGSTDRECVFTVSGAATASCNYIVQAGDTSEDLTVNSVVGVIQDSANNTMNNTTPLQNLAVNKAIVVDTSAPVIELTGLVVGSNSRNPILTLVSSEQGAVVFGGSCTASVATVSAASNLITLDNLIDGTYADCTVRVIDAAGNSSNTVSMPQFTIQSATVPKLSNTQSIAQYLAPSVVSPTPEEVSTPRIVLNLYPEYSNQTGKKLDLTVNQVVYFNVKDQEHSATITEIADGYVSFVLASKPKYARLMIGQTAQYDVNEDGVNDVEVSVLEVSGKYAGMTFKQLVHKELEAAARVEPSSNRYGAVYLGLLCVSGIVALIALQKRQNHDT